VIKIGAVWDFIAGLVNPTGAGILLIICGAVWVLDTVFEASRREGILKRDDNWDFDVTTLLKILTIIGCTSGAVFTVVGFLGYIDKTIPMTLTCTSLVILGILTLLKPVNDLPISSGIALLATISVATVMVSVISFLDYEINTTVAIILIIILVIVFVVCLGIAKFWLAGPQLVSKIVSWPVVSIIGAAYSFILGIIVLVSATTGLSIGI